ncbi:Tryptophan synthase alpha chain [Labilithrix luteola]|uniref:Tryptophan synthase alpha chain n=1 Tax=Labilithrix luteola TaxID=1391654 RepID=A0A0K1PKN0_9BACT|nr:hypothetical protein [Labilithrix luteola]AKU93951.1 Tryptophan synthase alpha chain [Labilithrix luteola]
MIPADGGAANTGCIDTACPAPLATCSAKVPCSINLDEDVDHCGACGNRCPSRSDNASYICSQGQCRLVCSELHADCNHLADDGCETVLVDDPANCGACGNACKDGEVCWKAACGCPKGFTQCGDTCVNTSSDQKNCGACGSVCSAPDRDDPRWTCGPGFSPPNTAWLCGGSSCNLACKPHFADCNQLFCGDGCEVDLQTDPANCGACGNACSAGQDCVAGVCLCPPQLTKCGLSVFLSTPSCVDLNSDVENCGACGHQCPGIDSRSGSPGCQDGVCTYVCAPGFADCNGRAIDGCEVDLMRDQKHCGSCKTSCDVAAGQPCISGQCQTKPCETPVVH